jgi:hypothetical protein
MGAMLSVKPNTMKRKVKYYYHILEYGMYDNVGWHGYHESVFDAEKEIIRLENLFPHLEFRVWVDTSTNEPIVTTI